MQRKPSGADGRVHIRACEPIMMRGVGVGAGRECRCRACRLLAGVRIAKSQSCMWPPWASDGAWTGAVAFGRLSRRIFLVAAEQKLLGLTAVPRCDSN